jgi:hypothetical protein
MSDWLELELAEELHPTAAPDELWERLRCLAGTRDLAVTARGVPSGPGPRPAHRREVPRVAAPSSARWTAWPIAAIVSMMIAAATLWLAAKGQEPVLNLQQLAIRELGDPAPLDLRSSNPSQIDEWMRRQTGLELTIPERNGAHLSGARVIQKGGARIGAVTYRVGDDTATLLVARAAPAADFGHGHVQWQARGQTYALASSNPDHPEAACLLCHASL